MSILRYSFIIGDFYGIKLPREELALIDAHFLAASHHFYRSKVDLLSLSRFHADLFWRHLNHLMDVVKRGDFANAFDNTQRGLDQPEGWKAGVPSLDTLEGQKELFPDPEMFLDMLPDVRFPVGDSHPYDALLGQSRIRPVQIHLELVTA